MGFCEETKRLSSYKDDSFVYNHVVYKGINPQKADYHVHDIFEIIFNKRGDISYTVEGKNYHVKKNGLIFARPGERHSLNFNDFAVYDRYDIFFDQKTFSSQIYHKLPKNIDVLNTEGYPYINELFEKMEYYHKYFRGDDLRNLLYHLTEELLYNILLLSDIFTERSPEKLYSANPIVLKAVEYIEKNIDIPFFLEDLCDELFVTKSHLHRLFSQHLGITPKKYINLKRLILAQKSIRQGKKPAHIYQKCGFAEYSTFWREYKKHFGYSPSEEIEKEQNFLPHYEGI